MLTPKRRHIPFILTCLFFLTFTIACSGNGAGTNVVVFTNSTPTSTVVTPTPTATPVPVTTTTCPALTTGRVAVLPSFQQGTHQNIVYLIGSSDAANRNGQLMDLNRYDVSTGTTTTITGGAINTAQISPDGQWLLFSVIEDSIPKIQLVRMDGKYRQTLYCAPQSQHVSGMQWSPDQKHIVFSQGASYNNVQIYILDLSSGTVQQLLKLTGNNQSFYPVTWLDNTRIYIKSYLPGWLYLLNTSKGPDQQIADMQLIRRDGASYWWDFDISTDGKTLFMGILNTLKSSPYYQSEIDISTIDGSNSKRILLSQTLVITNVRTINSSSLMFVSFSQSATQAQSDNFGLWKINIDGSGLTHLTRVLNKVSGGPGAWGQVTPYTQSHWSNFSRDGTLYVDANFYGSFSGGPLTSYANGGVPVGWTTM